jgi:hypothetical protein
VGLGASLGALEKRCKILCPCWVQPIV